MMTTDKVDDFEERMMQFLEVVALFIKNKKSTFMKNPSAGVVTISDENLLQDLQGEVSKVLVVAGNQAEAAEGGAIHPDDVAAPSKAMEKIRETIARVEADPAITPEVKTLLGEVKQDLIEIDGPQSRVTHTR